MGARLKKYPLDPLVKLRDRQVDEATRGLADAVTARQAAERKKAEADAIQARAEEAARLLREKERLALDSGTLRAADLHRAQAWEMGVAETQKRMAREVEVASQGEATARTREDEARTKLAAREADADVVEKDKEKFVAGEVARQLAKEEEEGAEAHGAQKKR